MLGKTKETTVPSEARLKKLTTQFSFTSEVPPIDTPVFRKKAAEIISAANSSPRSGHHKSFGQIKSHKHNSIRS
jgi:hypothetical protein